MENVIMYGRGSSSIAEQIGSTTEEAQKIIDDFYSGFPQVKQWMDETDKSLKTVGYVEDFWGRRRRLPDIFLPKYTVRQTGEISTTFNPLLGSKGFIDGQHNQKVDRYKKLLEGCRGYKEVNSIKQQAEKDGITIINNGAFISQAERQSVNARIQGSSATLSKLAMLKIYNDPVLRDLGFKMSIMVHDEVIGECPEENADAVAKRLPEMMIQAAVDAGVRIPMKCDPTIITSWYEDEVASEIQETFQKRISKGENEKAVYMDMTLQHEELTEKQLREILSNYLTNIDGCDII